MAPQMKQIDEDIFTVSNLFSPDECLQLIGLAESIGFEAAAVRTVDGPKMKTHIRNNDRVALTDARLAADMWHRIAPYLPVLDGCCACGVDSRIRFYRYFPGQHFKRHKDGTATNELGQRSKLSYLIYLNDDCTGGSTAFPEYRDVNGKQEKIEYLITPATGTALLFRHERWHEGTPVSAGAKYVLRSDVFYRSIRDEQISG